MVVIAQVGVGDVPVIVIVAVVVISVGIVADAAQLVAQGKGHIVPGADIEEGEYALFGLPQPEPWLVMWAM